MLLVLSHRLEPISPVETHIECRTLFQRSTVETAGFDGTYAAEFWDVVNRQDWAVCAGVQEGIRARVHTQGFYAPMEDWNLDIRRYVTERIGAFVGDHPA